ncbi:MULTISPECIES: iron-sulfur cluster assembly accessory protein [Meiothermus]|uniref:Heme biosynthesis protein HemY n=2 Tax=Meiothermus hypogaeus TaxID=884155 RepID=A0A511R4A1_9DEIN|nr:MULTISPECIES: iron-sulfur cluster assembly accessory protein [Meiothermus]RIH75255.1 Iron-sulfur cluster insertion protein ErpA [Meiothermus hypogaeus]GEM84429.1 heme biosynthesis protein HemY [Meiothermus hypogaeus NBRC 106114]GIW32701.1 MAG: heme biosynthesis protein HemY [Meiothermus sp.]GIW36916.1 MAG: heme biosynthesis protein HemY [Meiothermus sp.]
MVQEQTVLSITPLAAERAKEILNRYNKPHAAIRVFIKSGGCSGYQYGMAVDERELEGDTSVEMYGVRLVVDRMSLPLLAGSEVDWVENLMGGGFSVNNPQATSSCGCGHSFRTDGAKAPDGEGSGGCCSSH